MSVKKREYLELSRREWHKEVDRGEPDWPGIEYINMACLQRIADATEKMSENHDRLIRDRDYYRGESKRKGEEIERLRRKITGLRGAITRMKKTKE